MLPVGLALNETCCGSDPGENRSINVASVPSTATTQFSPTAIVGSDDASTDANVFAVYAGGGLSAATPIALGSTTTAGTVVGATSVVTVDPGTVDVTTVVAVDNEGGVSVGTTLRWPVSRALITSAITA